MKPGAAQAQRKWTSGPGEVNAAPGAEPQIQDRVSSSDQARSAEDGDGRKERSIYLHSGHTAVQGNPSQERSHSPKLSPEKGR